MCRSYTSCDSVDTLAVEPRELCRFVWGSTLLGSRGVVFRDEPPLSFDGLLAIHNGNGRDSVVLFRTNSGLVSVLCAAVILPHLLDCGLVLDDDGMGVGGRVVIVEGDVP